MVKFCRQNKASVFEKIKNGQLDTVVLSTSNFVDDIILAMHKNDILSCLRNIILMVILIFVAFCMSGGKPGRLQLLTYEANGVMGIDIETGAISASISIPMPSVGMNLKNPADVIANVPDTASDLIPIKPEANGINIENVCTGKLAVKTQYGNIILSGASTVSW